MSRRQGERVSVICKLSAGLYSFVCDLIYEYHVQTALGEISKAPLPANGMNGSTNSIDLLLVLVTFLIVRVVALNLISGCYRMPREQSVSPYADPQRLWQLVAQRLARRISLRSTAPSFSRLGGTCRGLDI